MPNVLNLVAWCLAIPLSAILIYLTSELCVGLGRSNAGQFRISPAKWTGAILVPAHNEALSIAATVSALRQAAPHCRIVVVADNCTDNTADLARAAGAEAIIRQSLTDKGKGFALAYGRDYLAKTPPDAVIIIDADCRLSAGSADILIARAVQGDQPVQGVYLLEAAVAASPLTRISNFAMLVKNLVRARGLEHIAGGAMLFGSGMAFPWKMFSTLDLATSHAVEDLALGLSLAKQGIRVGFENRVFITSPAVSGAASMGQRSRWEHGFLQTAMHDGLPIFLSGLRHHSRHLLFIGAHMLVPPLAMLIVMSVMVLVLISILFWAGYGSLQPVLILLGSLFLLTIALLAAWWKEGRRVISGRALLMIPFYVMWKLPIYLRFFTARQTGWNRTQRDGEQP